MKTFLKGLGLAVLAVAALVVSLITGSVGMHEPAYGAQAAKDARWEYGEFSLDAGLNQAVWEGPDGKVITSEQRNFKDMSVKLGGKPGADTTTAVLNTLGEQGWELVSQSTFVFGGRSTPIWTFKRKK